MTTYTTIANTAVDAGSPVDEALVTALRDNPIAITEGASGAPRSVAASMGADVGVWVLLETVTIAASGHGDNIDFTDAAIANYGTLRITGHAFNDATDTGVAFRTGNGGTFDSGGSDYAWYTITFTYNSTTATVGRDISGSQIQIGGGIDLDNDCDVAFDILIQGANDATKRTLVTANVTAEANTSSTFIGGTSYGERAEDAAHDRFRIYRMTASGEWQNGTVKIWGLLNGD